MSYYHFPTLIGIGLLMRQSQSGLEYLLYTEYWFNKDLVLPIITSNCTYCSACVLRLSPSLNKVTLEKDMG